jgi:type I restriction enzyme S subunit
MSSEWSECSLGDLIDIKHGFAFSGDYISKNQGKFVLVTPGNFEIGGGFKEGSAKYFHGQYPEEYVFSPGDLVVTMTDLSKTADTLGYSAKIPGEKGKTYLHNQRVGKVSFKSSDAELDFLYWVMRHTDYRRWVLSTATGSTVKHTSPSRILDYTFLLPPLPEQKAIAHILGTLDDKIELNRKTNETLEAMAKALFKSWFVDFDPVRAKAEGRPTGLPAEISDLFPDSFEDSELGEIPSGWSVGEINQILNLQKDSLDPATAPDEAFDHYSIPAFDAGKYPAKELGSSIKSQKFLVGDGDLLVSKLNPSTPRVWIPFASSGRRAICSTEFLVCRTSSVFGRAYAYCLASSDAIVEALTGLAGGTSNSHQRIRPGDFLALPCCIGTEIVRSAFLDVVEPLLGKSLVLRTESRSLSTTRDALLPKLISGEIRIPDAEKMLEEMLT